MKQVYALLATIVCIIGLGIVGICHTASPDVAPGQPDVLVKMLDPRLGEFVNDWQAEIGRRFHNSEMVLAHGGQFVEGQWIVGTERMYGGHVETMEDVIARAEKCGPGRTIVILCCNPDHVVLHGHPNVWYAKSSVWCVPDRNYDPRKNSFYRSHLKFSNVEIKGGEKVGAEWSAAAHITSEPFVTDDRPLRSVSDPDCVGNIYEFVNGA
jgi:hypothetical protein